MELNLAIIGAGQIGSRHLQGIKKSINCFNIHIVDIDSNSLNIAKRRFDQATGNDNHNLFFYKSFVDIPNYLDLVIIATTASVRSKILIELLKYAKIKFLILEKVVFQIESDFPKIISILERENIKAWVNCSRRLFSSYKNLKNEIFGEKLDIVVRGSEWGLACNAIHYIDLLAFLSGEGSVEIDISKLNKKNYDSKRKKFHEIKGKLSVKNNRGDTLVLSDIESQESFTVQISTKSQKFIVDEPNDLCIRIDSNGKKFSTNFDIEFQSQIAGKMIDQILMTSNSELVTIQNCSLYHIPMLKSFNKHFSKILGTKISVCPIT